MHDDANRGEKKRTDTEDGSENPRRGRLASASIASMAFAPVSPSMSLIDDITCVVTASWPKSRPATAMAITIMGPSENTE
jgi:hypothetical protein